MGKKLGDWWPCSALAREWGVPRSTLQSAAVKGYVDSDSLGDGTLVVSRKSAEQWAKVDDTRVRRPRAS